MSLPKPQKSVTDNFKSLELESAESFPSPALLRVRQRIENGCDSPSIKLPPSPTLSKLGKLYQFQVYFSSKQITIYWSHTMTHYESLILQNLTPKF